MALINCPECGKEMSDSAAACPNCGCPNPNNKKAKKKIDKKIIVPVCLVVVAIICVISLVGIILNLNPANKYLSLFNARRYDEASKFYAEKIEDNAESVEKIEEKQKSEIDLIYNEFEQGKIEYKDALDGLSVYKKSNVVSAYCKEVQGNIESLNSSRRAFEEGKKLEQEDDIPGAINKYKTVSKLDSNYDVAQNKIDNLSESYKSQLLADAENYANNKEYDEAIQKIGEAENVFGTSEEYTELKEKYSKLKNERYVTVKVIDTSVQEADTSRWIFNNRVYFTFSVTNNTDKAIQGISGVLTINDLFGKEILPLSVDFTGHIIEAGETYIEDNLSLDINPFIDSQVQVETTDYKDLRFVYEVSQIIFEDGTKVDPE